MLKLEMPKISHTLELWALLKLHYKENKLSENNNQPKPILMNPRI
jgi:hypothetical protein